MPAIWISNELYARIRSEGKYGETAEKILVRILSSGSNKKKSKAPEEPVEEAEELEKIGKVREKNDTIKEKEVEVNKGGWIIPEGSIDDMWEDDK